MNNATLSDCYFTMNGMVPDDEYKLNSKPK